MPVRPGPRENRQRPSPVRVNLPRAALTAAAGAPRTCCRHPAPVLPPPPPPLVSLAPACRQPRICRLPFTCHRALGPRRLPPPRACLAACLAKTVSYHGSTIHVAELLFLHICVFCSFCAVQVFAAALCTVSGRRAARHKPRATRHSTSHESGPQAIHWASPRVCQQACRPPWRYSAVPWGPWGAAAAVSPTQTPGAEQDAVTLWAAGSREQPDRGCSGGCRLLADGAVFAGGHADPRDGRGGVEAAADGNGVAAA